MFADFPKSIGWLLFGAIFLQLSSLRLHAMDEETAKTIADLKTQVQTLIEEVKKLKNQDSGG
ncbi:hypothetical protein EBX31_14535, partial [bacterium]|nr:hypothetical protein [bacterium]